MGSYMSVQEASALWGCSTRSVQMLCKQGSIPGAVKLSGIWLLPADSVHPGVKRAEKLPPFKPEHLYGKNTRVRVASSPGESRGQERGCIVTQYQILDGITLVFQDIHEEKLDYGNKMPRFPEELIAIQHCREGRFEGEYPNGEYIYMGPGKLSVNLPACSPLSNSFPLKHYHGLYITILPKNAEASIMKLEKILGPLHIDFSLLSGRLSGKNKLALYSVDEKTAQLINSIYPSRGVLPEEQLKLRVLELLQLLCTQEIPIPEPEHYFTGDQVKTVKAIRNYLISHKDMHISLPELAGKFHISLTGMKTCFKGVYGQSIGKYLREYRMQAGAEQLVSGNLKIIEIASALGYENPSKFAKAFSQYYGMSPNEYRKTFCPAGFLCCGEELKKG